MYFVFIFYVYMYNGQHFILNKIYLSIYRKPYEWKRSKGRPLIQWRVELDEYWKGAIWQTVAQDKKKHTEALAMTAQL